MNNCCNNNKSLILPVKKCKCCDKKVVIIPNDLCQKLSCQGSQGPQGPKGDTGPTGPTGSGSSGSQIGVEFLQTLNSSNGDFIGPSSARIWSANGLLVPTTPTFNTTTNIWAPLGSTISYINVVRGGTGISDYFTCSKNIKCLRFYTQIQSPTNSSGRWRTNLLLNDIIMHFTWASPLNNVANSITFGVLEYGGIPAGTRIYPTIDGGLLPISIKNQNSYFVIEYEL